KDKKYAYREYPHPCITRQNLLIGQICPFELDTARKNFLRNTFCCGLSLIGRIPRGRTAVDIRRVVAVVAHHHLRTEARSDRGKRRSAHHLPTAAACFQLKYVLRRRPVWCIGLGTNLVDPSKAVEVVYIQRTQVYLHGFEHIIHWYSQLLGL